MLIYYNQRNYANVPYPSAALPDATVKSGGCGVCCASMIVENLLGQSFPPPQSAKLSIQSDARVVGGTDMDRLSKSLCGAFSLKCEATTSIGTTRQRIQAGAMAIAHTKGGDKGLFSTGGHFVVLAGFSNKEFTVLDPYLYAGKYTLSYRKGKATQKGNFLFVSAENVASDCKKYYIFERNEPIMTEITVEQAKQIIKQKAGLSDTTIQFLYNYRYGDDLLKKLANAMK